MPLLDDPYVTLEAFPGLEPTPPPGVTTLPRVHALLLDRLTAPPEGWQDAQGQWHPRWTLGQCGAQCQVWAQWYADVQPALAEDLRAGAMIYAALDALPARKQAC